MAGHAPTIEVPKAPHAKIAIISSSWHLDICHDLIAGAKRALAQADVKEISVTHGKIIEEIGYHCRDYFLSQWDKFKNYPWGVVAHSTHVRGIGTFENGVEKCRVQVTLASQVPEAVCKKINLGYRDPRSINVESYANRESEGVLLVRKAGEMLYRLKHPPAWAKES